MKSQHSINFALNKRYSKAEISDSDLTVFFQLLSSFLQGINPEESEEYNKNLLIRFLSNAFYEGKHLINTKQRADLAIYSTNAPDSDVEVIFETKKPNSPEMISQDNFCKKAMYEVILYFLRERITNKNYRIKHLIISDIYQWYIFDAQLFDKLFAQDKTLVKYFQEYENPKNLSISTNDAFYNNIIRPAVEKVADKLNVYTYFDIRKFNPNTKAGKSRAASLYKFLSPQHLLKEYQSQDVNMLNRKFYNELLYILGLTEKKENENTIICRLDEKRRQDYSLIENTIYRIEEETSKAEQFDIALELVITWINRILFLKLLEAQLVKIHKDSKYQFLTYSSLKGFDLLNDLFFKVMAIPMEQRHKLVKDKFKAIPYLNSSLFEKSDMEQKYIAINELNQETMNIYRDTVLTDANGKTRTGKINNLEYLLLFLNAYNFGTTNKDDKNKTLINASVLGLIFEKINGYKDGAIFTPAFITEYICRSTLRQAVVNKFNDIKGWQCRTFDELKETIEYGNRECRIEANRIVNSLRICDPAVGSGHFLVAALNELIYIKSELNILQDHSETPHRIKDYKITVENDELLIYDEDGEYFSYAPTSSNSQAVQQALFEEKQAIIENCLFGVDINPKSVEICRLRLWIELLKNAYYHIDENGTRALQTLPNIDINIKCGDSLFSKYPVCIGKSLPQFSLREDTDELINDYKSAVSAYKQTADKQKKRTLAKKIAEIKVHLVKDVEYDLFDKQPKKTIKLQTLEWGMEFPEVLSANGAFQGFDAIIGNPPYIHLESNPEVSKLYAKMKRLSEKNERIPMYSTHDPRGDMYTLFVERGLRLLQPQGLLSYIIPNKWLNVGYGSSLRKLFCERNLIRLTDFGDNQVFTDATTYTCIIQMSNEANRGEINISSIPSLKIKDLNKEVETRQKAFPTHQFDENIWVISSPKAGQLINRLEKRSVSLGTLIGENYYYGIKTGLTNAFLISKEQKEELINQNAEAAEVIRPFLQGRGLEAFKKVANTESYLLFIPKGYTRQRMEIEESQPKPSEEEAWKWLKETYPSVAQWLEPFAEKAKRRTDKGDYWWELRACSYYEKFQSPKIFYQAFQVKPCFVYDENDVFCNNSMWFLSTDNKGLLGVFCSEVGWWLISQYCPRIQNGRQLIWDNFSKIPVPERLPDSLSSLVQQIMDCKENELPYSDLVKELNNLVYDIYGITEEERSIFQPLKQ